MKNEKLIIDIWNQGMNASLDNEYKILHGDISLGNILIEENKLSSIIDFGCN